MHGKACKKIAFQTVQSHCQYRGCFIAKSEKQSTSDEGRRSEISGGSEIIDADGATEGYAIVSNANHAEEDVGEV